VPGVVLAAAYLLWLYQRVFFGTVDNPKNEKLLDLSAARAGYLRAAGDAVALWIGLYPKPFFQILEQPVNHTMAMARPDYPQPAVNADRECIGETLLAPVTDIPVIIDDRASAVSRPNPRHDRQTKGKN
jgi:hypothetical protein